MTYIYLFNSAFWLQSTTRIEWGTVQFYSYTKCLEIEKNKKQKTCRAAKLYLYRFIFSLLIKIRNEIIHFLSHICLYVHEQWPPANIPRNRLKLLLVDAVFHYNRSQTLPAKTKGQSRNVQPYTRQQWPINSQEKHNALP